MSVKKYSFGLEKGRKSPESARNGFSAPLRPGGPYGRGFAGRRESREPSSPPRDTDGKPQPAPNPDLTGRSIAKSSEESHTTGEEPLRHDEEGSLRGRNSESNVKTRVEGAPQAPTRQAERDRPFDVPGAGARSRPPPVRSHPRLDPVGSEPSRSRRGAPQNGRSPHPAVAPAASPAH